jgi:hercynine metabolism protein
MSRSWLEELEAQLEQQLEGFLRANPRQEELLAEQEARDRQLSLRQERLLFQQRAEATRQRLLELAQEIRLWQQRRDKASAAGAADLATRAAAHLADLMERGRGDWQSLTDLGQRFASVEAALDALNNPSDPARAASAAAPGAKASRPSQPPPAGAQPGATPGAQPSASGGPSPQPAQPGQPTSGPSPAPAAEGAGAGPGAAPAGAGSGATPAGAGAGANRRGPAAGSQASGAPGGGRPPVDPAVDLEAAWHAFATQQELEELRRRVGS